MHQQLISSKITPSYGTYEYEEMDHLPLDRTETKGSIKEYISNPYLLFELLACVLFVSLGHFTPSHIFRMTVYERDIPYLQTANGDIILDQYINRPLVDGESIPDWLLIVLGPILTAMIVLPMSYCYGPKGDTHAAMCALMFGVGCNVFFTAFFKLYVGYWRPNFYNLCEFSADNMRCEAEDDTQGRLSFPSGHASLSFCCMTFLTLFFYGKIGLHSLKAAHLGGCDISTLEREILVARMCLKKRVVAILATAPISLAMFISASRVRDNYHHPADIVCGALVGSISAIFSYGLWYSSFSGIPLQTTTEEMALKIDRNPTV